MSHHESWPGEPSDVADLEDELDEPGDDEDDDEDTGDEPAPLDDEPDDDEPDDDEPDEDDPYDGDEPSLRFAGHAGGELDVPDDVDLLEGEPRSTRRGVGVVVSRTLPVAAQSAPPAGVWSTLAPMPTPRQELSVAVLDGKVFVLAGYDTHRDSV